MAPADQAVADGRARLAEIDRLRDELLDRMGRSAARQPYHLAARSYRRFDAELADLQAERDALAATLPPAPTCHDCRGDGCENCNWTGRPQD
jgi:hypothetical protein